MTLIHGKRVLLFGDSSIPLPIRLSRAELELKMAAIRTYWEVDLVNDGLEEGAIKEKAVLGHYV
jgi:hypothetical protein